ncbi:L-fucose:H+ symporter permease [Sphingobacterium sp. SGG-5]|uniref:L-fucose:H+ symporter permease n=1 Tax=Sphingobacterium sp. SGG-5 TaxID=2710881 RepID=UPI0013EDF3D0|nr:L-fucose:H+ symporter permease [Sphingobacterium sp. SGG-5]NGM60928.1 L-fucose:H+ symporter permease [Sphingobacterium sp. SGG-5]
MGRLGKQPYLLPFVLITSLFFMWGFAISMLDVLNKHFQDALHVTKAQSGLIQLAVYGAYFLMALPTGYFMQKYSYKRVILVGLGLYATGAFLFYPATQIATFEFFLMALFVLGCGLAIIETAANPYVTVLGKPAGAATRLNLAQSFNGLGVILGPLIGGLLLFAGHPEDMVSLVSIRAPYLVIGMLALSMLFVFYTVDLPEIQSEGNASYETTEDPRATASIFRQKHFVYGIVTLFFYVGAQAGVWAFFINYAVEEASGMTNQKAAFYLAAAMVAYTIGRFGGTWLMQYFSPRLLLLVYAVLAILSIGVVLAQLGIVSVYALILSCFCMSIMFPTVFSLGIRELGSGTKRAGSYMIMSIVGGAVFPPLMGWVADATQTSFAFFMPLICFSVVLWYGWSGYKKRSV